MKELKEKGQQKVFWTNTPQQILFNKLKSRLMEHKVFNLIHYLTSRMPPPKKKMQGCTFLALHFECFIGNFRYCKSLLLLLWIVMNFPRTSTCFWLSSSEAASSSFFSSKALPSSAARMRSVSITPPLSLLPGQEAAGGRVKESDTDEDEERGKKESSRLGEGRLVCLEVNISFQLGGVTSKTSSQNQETRRRRSRKKIPSCFLFPSWSHPD